MSSGKSGAVRIDAASTLVSVTGSGRRTPINRGARPLRSSRTANSSLPASTIELFLATPTSSQNPRMASGVKPRRRIPARVGMRGSSQPFTTPSATSLSSLRLLIMVYASTSRANSYCRGGVEVGARPATRSARGRTPVAAITQS